MQFAYSTDLHYGSMVALSCGGQYLQISPEGGVGAREVSLGESFSDRLFVLVPLKPNSPMPAIEARARQAFGECRQASEQQKQSVLETCLDGLYELDYFVSELLEEEDRKKGQGILFGDRFHLQHYRTGKYLGHSVNDSKGSSEMLLGLYHSPTENTFFSARNCYEYQKKISNYPRYF